jgi:hypothetical protein
MPYRQAWGLITAWSERMGKPLVTKEQGRSTRPAALGEQLLSIRERISAWLTPHLESALFENLPGPYFDRGLLVPILEPRWQGFSGPFFG